MSAIHIPFHSHESVSWCILVTNTAAVLSASAKTKLFLTTWYPCFQFVVAEYTKQIQFYVKFSSLVTLLLELKQKLCELSNLAFVMFFVNCNKSIEDNIQRCTVPAPAPTEVAGKKLSNINEMGCTRPKRPLLQALWSYHTLLEE